MEAPDLDSAAYARAVRGRWDGVGEPVPSLVHFSENADEADGDGHPLQDSQRIRSAESVVLDGESVHRPRHETVQGVWPNPGRAIEDRGPD